MTAPHVACDDGRPLFIASFHALTRSFPDLADVEMWLQRVDGNRESEAATSPRHSHGRVGAVQ
jgi:hypothetical protein